jgi:hypothetical protein
MSVGYRTHQSFATTSVHDVYAGFGKSFTQGPGIVHVDWIASGFGCTENGDAADARRCHVAMVKVLQI